MAARNLHHVRDLIGADLTEQVDRITSALNEQTEVVVRRFDNPRGWPFSGEGIGGAIYGTIPGTDEHVERLDNVRNVA
jgi:hypothetical protein